MKKRVSAVIIDGDKILLIRRVKPDAEYYTLPGGTVEEGESLESAMIREAKEELSVDVKISKLLFEINSDERIDYYFLIESFTGTPELGGPEKERTCHGSIACDHPSEYPVCICHIQPTYTCLVCELRQC